MSAVLKCPNTTDAQIKQTILGYFSTVGPRTEANHYLKKMRLDNNESLISHNAEYAAVHLVGHLKTPEQQEDQQILHEYANTLILRDNSYIKTLRDTMEEAEIIHKQSQQEEISRIECDPMRKTTVTDSITNLSLSEASINALQTQPSDNYRLNSTMKSTSQGFSPSNKYGDNKYGDNKYGNKNWKSNNFNKRGLQRYRHQSRWPKKDIQFEYNSADENMYGNLRRTINFMKDREENRQAARRFPRFTNRAVEEVSEDAIATITITEIQNILNEDVDLIFDVIVMGDYIEDEEEA